MTNFTAVLRIDITASKTLRHSGENRRDYQVVETCQARTQVQRYCGKRIEGDGADVGIAESCLRNHAGRRSIRGKMLANRAQRKNNTVALMSHRAVRCSDKSYSALRRRAIHRAIPRPLLRRAA
jgi:hypothetical protein